MGCRSSRKQAEIRPEQKWDAISLKDFKSSSCFAPFAYAYLYFSLLLSLAVYGVDTFTAINLLAFNTWSSSIDPTQLIPFDVSKWIFSICIIASFVNLAFEHLRAMRVMKRGSVAECYLDNLAVRLESVRPGDGQGWRRFLVFAELTKSKKGAEYVALFTYFNFQSWIRVIFCSGPRQAVNALTLYAVYTSDLIPTDVSSVESTLGTFFAKLQQLASENTQQVVILSGMLFTLVIWVISFLFLLTAALFYVFFLWHYIPRQDGGLHGYCERKVNKRLTRIVTVKVNKALAKEERDRLKAEYKAAKKAGEKPPVERQATLPTFMDAGNEDKLPEMPMLNRTDTMATLPAYSSRPGSTHSIELDSWDQKRPTPASSFSSRAHLVGQAAPMGFERTASPAPSLPSFDPANFQPPILPASSNRSFGPDSQPSRLRTSGNVLGGGGYTASPSTYSSDALPSMPQPIRSPAPVDTFSRQMPRPINQFGGRSSNGGPTDGRSSPAPSTFSNWGPPANGPAYNGRPYPPPRSATNPVSSAQRPPPQRNMTGPMPPRQPDGYYGQRPGTVASQRNVGQGYSYGSDLEAQRGFPRY
ncbi:Potassium transporter [Parahypoxylon ruwenzoriense]